MACGHKYIGIVCQSSWCGECLWKDLVLWMSLKSLPDRTQYTISFEGLWMTKTVICEDWGFRFLLCLNPSACSLKLTNRINCSWLVTLCCLVLLIAVDWLLYAVLSYSLGKSSCSFPVKLTLDWIRLDPKVLQDSAFTSRLQIWPSLCKLLNGLQKAVADFTTDKCK
jgi:protein SMG7